MVYLLIVLGLAVVIAPLMSAMPSKAQRARAALRDKARCSNLRVSLRPMPAIPARFRLRSGDEYACYERRLPSNFYQADRNASYVFVGGEWSPTIGVSPVPAWLSTLPAGVVFVELAGRTVSIFWNEKDGPEGLDRLSYAIDSIV